MPLVRISLLKGRTPTQLRAIADNVHDALVETYGVPAKDRFQVIDERDPGTLIYSRDYLDIERTDGIVLIHIIAGRWRDTATKRALYRALADKLSTHAGVRPEDVQVSLTGNDKDDWSFGNGLASYVPESEPA